MMEGKTLILSSNEGEVHELNETGSWIWSRLEEPKSASELAKSYATIVDGKEEEIKKDFEEYFNQLSSNNLIVDHGQLTQ